MRMDMGSPYRRVGIIGTGRVAGALGGLLAQRSSQPALVWGRSRERASSVAEGMGHAEVASDIDQLGASCALIMIAVSDDAIAEVAMELADCRELGPQALVFHVSGRSGVSILSQVAKCGARTAAVHPVMTFTGETERDTKNVAGSHFAITADTEATAKRCVELVGLLGGNGFLIADEDRALYHAGLCHAANHLVTLMTQASHMLEAAGVPEPAQVFAPLVRAALENSIEQGLAALSGPLLRNDQQTIEMHLEAMDASAPDASSLYRALANATLDELERDGKPVSDAMRKLLARETESD